MGGLFDRPSVLLVLLFLPLLIIVMIVWLVIRGARRPSRTAATVPPVPAPWVPLPLGRRPVVRPRGRHHPVVDGEAWTEH